MLCCERLQKESESIVLSLELKKKTDFQRSMLLCQHHPTGPGPLCSSYIIKGSMANNTESNLLDCQGKFKIGTVIWDNLLSLKKIFG